MAAEMRLQICYSIDVKDVLANVSHDASLTRRGPEAMSAVRVLVRAYIVRGVVGIASGPCPFLAQHG